MRSLLLSSLALCVASLQVPAQSGRKTSSAAKAPEPERLIQADFNKAAGPLNTFFKTCIGAGRANEGLRADWQQQLAYVKKQCGFSYIRMHGLLTDDMGVYKEDDKGNPTYNFMYVDALTDYLQHIGMKPFIELGFMPAALASGPQTIFWWRGHVTPPKDYQKWGALIEELTRHFTERYGADEVKTWYFEVWNEPNLTPGFWTGTQQEYFQLYQSAVKAIKSVNKDYRVGGPATAGAAWESEMIEFCLKNQLPIDFVSTHSYGVNQGFLDEYGHTGTVLDKNKWAVSGDVLQSRKEISQSARPGLELHYTEWSASYTPADPIHDSYHEAAYILQKLKQVGAAANSMSYWVFTDIFEEPGPRFEPFHGGFGLMTIQGINKPAFYSYQFLNRLGATELVNSDSASWVCKDAAGNLQALVWDYTYTLPDSTNNQQYYIRDLPAKEKGKLKINLTGLPEGHYSLSVYRVGYKSNDAYTAYVSMGKPQQLSRQQVAAIKKQSDGSPFLKEIISVGNNTSFSKELDLRENDVVFLELTKL